jgi:agmatinase
VLALPGVERLVQVGVRGFLQHDAAALGDARRSSLTPSQLRRHGTAGLLARVPAEAAVYVSIDIDVLDPALAPGTRTPRANGLQFAELRDMLDALGRSRSVVGVDLVEVNPDRDLHGLTALLAAELRLGFLGSIGTRLATCHAAAAARIPARATVATEQVS